MSISTAQPSSLATRRGKLTLALLCLVAFLDFVDASIVNVALPPIFGAAHGPDLATELDAALTDEQAAFEVLNDYDMVVHHPAGDIPAARLLQFRTSDYLLHSWDVARATDTDERLPADLVATTWERMHPMAHLIGKLGAFGTGPSGTIGQDAPLQQRLLDLTGRRP
jgi:uncharacterized protein (TIGR03086 family)